MGAASACLGAEGDWMRMRRLVLITDTHCLAVGLDAEEDKGESHKKHAKGEKQVSRQYRVRGRLWGHDVAAAGDERQAQRADNLSDAIRCLPEAGCARAETHPVPLDRVRCEIGESALDEKGRGAQQDDHCWQPA